MIEAPHQVVAACHRLAAEGLLIGTAGNVSVRVGDRVAVTATGAVLGELTEDQVVEVDLDGHQVGGSLVPTSEVYLHLSIYEKYDVAAVVHTHAPVSTAASISLGVDPGHPLPAAAAGRGRPGGAVRDLRHAGARRTASSPRWSTARRR